MYIPFLRKIVKYLCASYPLCIFIDNFNLSFVPNPYHPLRLPLETSRHTSIAESFVAEFPTYFCELDFQGIIQREFF